MMETTGAGSESTLRILMVDDDEVDRRVARRHLASCGLSLAVEETNDPVVALSLARSGRFDCVLMDYRYPRGSAFELFGELFAEPCSRRPPIVLLTGSGGERVAAESIQRGAQEYLSKGEVGSDALRLAIESAMGKARHELELELRDRELLRMSFYDALTGLPNRRLFLDRLDQAARESARSRKVFAVLMMDLNLFKGVNDTYGHEVGDQLLAAVAERLRGATREADTVARLGGDEFAALLTTANSLEGAAVAAQKIVEAVDAPFVLGERVVYVGISVGIALAPDHGDNGELLMRNADMALYDSKRTTRGIRVHGQTRTSANHEASLIAQGLKGAVAEGELFAVYQPQVRLSDGAVTGLEALVRWRHPDLGLVPAMKFVPAAERSEAIVGLTMRVLDLALAQQRSLHEEGIDLRVAVNLSARLLDQERLAESVAERIELAGVPAASLCLEVTETGIMHAPDVAERTLRALSDVGVRLSIDDFGTGYSSLKYLRNFPIDEIKIDGLFVGGLKDDPRDGIIVESVLALGRAFGVRVIAEGVEDDAAWSALCGLGCEHGQGYRFGRPMAPLELRRWLRSWEGADPASRRRPGGPTLSAAAEAS